MFGLKQVIYGLPIDSQLDTELNQLKLDTDLGWSIINEHGICLAIVPEETKAHRIMWLLSRHGWGVARRRTLPSPLRCFHDADAIYCTYCKAELPKGVAIDRWQWISVGLTPKGIQVWCNRHHANLLHIDFERHNHPTNDRKS
jgi:hypothetical protein